MTRVTFGVSFAANIAVKQNVLDFATEFPMAVDTVQSLPAPHQYIKTLGVECNSNSDLTISNLPPLKNLTKRELVSDLTSSDGLLQ